MVEKILKTFDQSETKKTGFVDLFDYLSSFLSFPSLAFKAKKV
jgi:hypothetical protein